MARHCKGKPTGGATSARPIDIAFPWVLSHYVRFSDTGQMKPRKSLYHRHRFPQDIIRHAVATRQRERTMRGFESMGQAQRFLAVHGTMRNLFAIPRHLMRAKHYRLFRTEALDMYQQVTCA